VRFPRGPATVLLFWFLLECATSNFLYGGRPSEKAAFADECRGAKSGDLPDTGVFYSSPEGVIALVGIIIGASDRLARLQSSE
jgi:hypothetical protein